MKTLLTTANILISLTLAITLLLALGSISEMYELLVVVEPKHYTELLKFDYVQHSLLTLVISTILSIGLNKTRLIIKKKQLN